MTIHLLAPFPYANTKVAPWRYGHVVKEDGVLKSIPEAPVAVENITDPSKMTRSGQMFSVVPLIIANPQSATPAEVVGAEVSFKEAINNDNAAEFLKIIRKND